MRGEQAIFNLEIKKKSGLSINPDIHHSKVFSSGIFRCFYFLNFVISYWKINKRLRGGYIHAYTMRSGYQ